MNEIIIIGINHRTAPVEIRERLTKGVEDLTTTLRTIYRKEGVGGCVVVSTCNRIEFVLHAEEETGDLVTGEISRILSMEKENVVPLLYTFTGQKAVNHLFRVASSLDSMIMGEPQILGQVKGAFAAAVEAGTTDSVLNLLFQRAFMVAKKVRSDTGIGRSAVSVSFAAVEIARKIFGELKGKKAMLVGSGEMAELAAKHLVDLKVGELIILNRTLSHAEELAASLGGKGHPLDAMASLLDQPDVIITSTGSPGAILTRSMVREAMKRRGARSLLIVDIAVPRDTEADVGKLDYVYLYNIDDLKRVVEENVKEREHQAIEAQKIIDGGVHTFMERLNQTALGPVIKDLKEQMETIRLKELEKCLKAIGDLTQQQKEQIELFSSSMLAKVLHQPMVEIKHHGHEARSLQFIRHLFGLEGKE